MDEFTKGPWFVSGVRFKRDGADWQSINRYDESAKRDENIALVGFDARTGLGRKDAHLIASAPDLYEALKLVLENWKPKRSEYAPGFHGDAAFKAQMTVYEMGVAALAKAEGKQP